MLLENAHGKQNKYQVTKINFHTEHFLIQAMVKTGWALYKYRQGLYDLRYQ